MSEDIIQLVRLTKKYGDFTAVDQLTLTIQKGEIFGLLGPNGAGKSTTILMMLGLTEPTQGTVRVCGIDSVRQPIEVKKRVGYMPDDVGFYEDRSGFDNLVYTAQLNQIPKKIAQESAMQLLERVGLQDAAFRKTGTYSRGMRQRLGLADVLIKQPEVVILDEPTLGIDPEGVRDFLQLIVTLSRQDGITVLLSSHHLHQVQQICDRVGLFVKGQLLAEGTIESLSMTLFSEEPLVIEVELANQENLFDLINDLQNIEGIVRVDPQDHRLMIGCSTDVSTQIADLIAQSGRGLRSLVKKQYGLDEIYHRYFEGRELREPSGNKRKNA